MKKSILALSMCLLTLSGCDNKAALAESSFGKMSDKSSKASPANVISMGRDDEEGKAKKWHIGGRFDKDEQD